MVRRSTSARLIHVARGCYGNLNGSAWLSGGVAESARAGFYRINRDRRFQLALLAFPGKSRDTESAGRSQVSRILRSG